MPITNEENSNELASALNVSFYDKPRKFVESSPHLNHKSLRDLYISLIKQVVNKAKSINRMPTILDLGAGEGTATLPYLTAGCKVTAVDVSKAQLDALKAKCSAFGSNLEVVNCDINEFLNTSTGKWDVVVTCSLLHHIPDYVGLISRFKNVLNPRGLYFSFQDPSAYASLTLLDHNMGRLGYFWWRIFQGDLMGGLQTRLRRLLGSYDPNNERDFAEYHVVRSGVDSKAIEQALAKDGFRTDVVEYFSTHSSFFQRLGDALGLRNHFAIVAQLNDE